MLYPAELRAPARGRLSDLAGQGQQRCVGSCSDAFSSREPVPTSLENALVAGVPAAVLADIAGRALPAVVGRGAVIIGKAAGLETGPVIMQVADLVGQRPVLAVVAVMAGIRQARRQGGRGEEGGGDQKPCFGHLNSPEVPLKTGHFGRSGGHFTHNGVKSCGKSATRRQFLGPRGCLTKSQHSPAKVLGSGPDFTDRPTPRPARLS